MSLLNWWLSLLLHVTMIYNLIGVGFRSIWIASKCWMAHGNCTGAYSYEHVDKKFEIFNSSLVNCQFVGSIWIHCDCLYNVQWVAIDHREAVRRIMESVTSVLWNSNLFVWSYYFGENPGIDHISTNASSLFTGKQFFTFCIQLIFRFCPWKMKWRNRPSLTVLLECWMLAWLLLEQCSWPWDFWPTCSTERAYEVQLPLI